jgi:programmed cell death protein 5
MSSEDDLAAIRQRKIAELQAQQVQQGQAAQAQAQAHTEAEAQKFALMRKILTPEARERLQNVKLVKPEFAAQIEVQLLQLAQAGRVPLPINDDLLKQLLAQIQGKQAKREISIRRV